MPKLFLIPARAGSKGLPGKNSKLLKGKPLVSYSIEFALLHMKAGDALCISTNDTVIIEIARKYGIDIPFLRPEYLSDDSTSSHDVIIHAINFYEQQGQFFDAVMLLQPTSPFRTTEDFQAMIGAYDSECEMVVTVKESKENPYFNLFEENKAGYLEKSKKGDFKRRQDVPLVYAYNGAMYLIRVSALQKKKLHELEKVKKVIMPEERSVDIDSIKDWILAEGMIDLGLIA